MKYNQESKIFTIGYEEMKELLMRYAGDYCTGENFVEMGVKHYLKMVLIPKILSTPDNDELIINKGRTKTD